MRSASATEFCRSFGRYQHEAQRETVAVTSHGRTTRYLPLIAEYEELQALRARAGQHLRVGELPADVVEAIRSSEMDPRYYHLDGVMED